MRVAADHSRLLDPLELGGEVGLRGDPGHAPLVVGRQRVAAANGAEILDIDRERQRPFADGGQALGPQPVAHPAVPLGGILERQPVGVAAQEARGLVDRGDAVVGLGGERAGDDVTEDDDAVSGGEPRVGEHRLERVEVPVDVGDRGDRHARRA